MQRWAQNASHQCVIADGPIAVQSYPFQVDGDHVTGHGGFYIERAGLRIATVTTIGLVTVTFVIGKGGLGSLIYDGLIRDFKTPLVVGTTLSVALAVFADLTLAGIQRVITPWARSRAGT